MIEPLIDGLVAVGKFGEKVSSSRFARIAMTAFEVVTQPVIYIVTNLPPVKKLIAKGVDILGTKVRGLLEPMGLNLNRLKYAVGGAVIIGGSILAAGKVSKGLKLGMEWMGKVRARGRSNDYRANTKFNRTEFQVPNGRGTGQKYKVYQQDINWGLKGPKGQTNLELAKAGNSPYIMKDGRLQQVQLHHSRQSAKGPLYELTQGTHAKGPGRGGRALHPYKFDGTGKHPTNPVDHSVFRTDRNLYWENRASTVTGNNS